MIELLSQSQAGDTFLGINPLYPGLLLSDDARFAVFDARSNFDVDRPNDPQHGSGVFLRDRVTGTTKLVSINSLGEEQNGTGARLTAISGDGRYVFFSAQDATNLGVDPEFIFPQYGYEYNFRHDMVSGNTELVSVDNNGNPIPESTKSVSYNGNKIVIGGFLRDLALGTNYAVADGYIYGVSADGTKITYIKSTSGSPYRNSIFYRDITTEQDELIYEGAITGGVSDASISKDGRYVFFQSYDLGVTPETPDICQYAGCSYRHNKQTGVTSIINVLMNGMNVYPEIYGLYDASADGEKVVFDNAITAYGESYDFAKPTPTGLAYLRLDTNEIFSVGYGPNWTNPIPSDVSFSVISADGTMTAFVSHARNFGIPKMCSDDGGNIMQCTNAFLTTNIKNPNPDETEPGDDTTSPVLGELSWTANPKLPAEQSTLTISATDDISGVATVELFFCGEDPGVGNGFPMEFNGTHYEFIADETIPEGTYDICARAIDNAGNASEVVATQLIVGDAPTDTVAPAVTGTPDRAPNAAGWYSDDVTITWLATDPAPSSGTPTTPVPTTASLEGLHTYTSAQSCDPAGNCATGSLELKIDKTAPVISYSLSAAANGDGWHNGDVTVNFSCSDALSGVASCPASVTVGEGVNQQVSGIATDNAGNTATTTVTLNVDKTKPVLSYAVTGTLGSGGWYTSPVQVSFSCLDLLAGMSFCAAPVTLSDDGANQSASGFASDLAGNSESVTVSGINIDQTAPTTQTVSLSPNPVVVNGTAILSATANSDLSGIVTAEYATNPNGPWTAMSWDGATATASVTAPATAGMYPYYVRLTDAAGSVGAPVFLNLDVYNPTAGYAAAHGFIAPGGATSDPGDFLPTVTGNNIKATLDFTVKYANASAAVPTGDSVFTYGAQCNKPTNDCFRMVMNSFDWLMVPGDSTATYQGLATLYQGSSSQGANYPVRISVVDGGLTGPDHYLLRIYPAGVNPDWGFAPLYQASGDLTGGNVKLHQ